VNEPNLFGNLEFLKDLKSINDQSATTDLDLNRGESQARSGLSGLADALAADKAREEPRFDEELEKARLAIGATGAAIALLSEEKIVCHATSGSHVPDIGARLDLHQGLSDSCIQTRELQQCNEQRLCLPALGVSSTIRVNIDTLLSWVEGERKPSGRTATDGV
jgi:hypothetical protein